MRYLAIFAVCALQIASSVNSKGHYSVIAPGTVHGGNKYSVAVGVYDVSEPCKLNVEISGNQYQKIQTVDLNSNDLKTIDFDVPFLNKEGNYNLTIEGVSGLVFKNTTKLEYKEFNPYVKIQTDKGKYKPGDLVNFRIIFLDQNLKPSTISPATYAWIEDAKRNRIKEYKNLNIVRGVFTGEFQLSEFALLGDWRIIVDNGEKHYKPQVYFSVEKYVLPKYNVKIEATEDVSARDGDMQVVVRSNYTYGKPVNAKVTMIIHMDVGYYYYDKPESEKKLAPPIIKVADMVEGKAKFDLNIKEYADYMPDNSTSYYASITATVEENFTGVMINGTASSTFYPYRYKISCADWNVCTSFQADNETEIPLKVLQVDNSKIDDTKSIIKLHFNEVLKIDEYYHNRHLSEEETAEATTETTTETPVSASKYFVFESRLNESSVAIFKIKLDDLPEYKGYYHYYDVKVEFIDETHKLYSMYQYREPKNVNPEPEPEKLPTDWFKVDVHYTDDNKWQTEIGKETTFSINSSAPMSYFVYQITGRGNILHSERVQLPEPTKLHNFTIVPTFMMAPHSSVYVFFIDEEGELRYGETSFSVEVVLQNQIEISAAEEVKPGSEVALNIKTPKHSFVGLLAVDQSVLMLGENNDIRSDDFRWRLSGYSTSTPWQGGYSDYPGQRSGLVTLTNADYFYNWTKPEWAITPMHGLVSTRKYHASPAHGLAADSEVSGFSGKAGQPEMASGGVGGGSSVRVRTDFSETWLFTNIEDTQSDEFKWTKIIPDTITSWVVSAFSLNEEKGLGVTKERTKIRTFQPFFISLRLPYAVKRGEVINVPALVFNYLEKDLDVEITLENTDNEYEFVEASNEVVNEPKRVKSVRVPANSARGVSFMLRPLHIGNIMLKFSAVSPVAGDAIHKTLKVVPEGVTEYANRAYFVNLKNEPESKQSFELNLPKDVVVDSQHIEFGVVGDLLGPVLNNLENTVRMPLGCGEQVTSTLAPNHLVYKYLKDTNQLTNVLDGKIKRNMEIGYQRILNYRNDDGSFGSFGWLRHHPKRNGSTWLTAYVVRTLLQVSPYIEVDKKVITEGFAYLAKRQAENGSFVEAGDVFYSSQNQHVTRTASVLLAFLEDEENLSAHKSVIDKGLKYILENVKESKSLQAQALVAYVLHQAKHPAANEHITQLKGQSKSDEDRTWWSDIDRKGGDWWRWSFSSEVEATSYILLVLLDLDTENEQSVLPIIKWLVAQRNSNGGFSSTHDTVVGLEALIKFAKKSGYEPAVMDVDFTAKGSEKQDTVKVTNDNALLLQTVELPQKTTGVDFHAKGKGAALIQVAYQYNIVEKEKEPSFSINTIINKETPPFKLQMDVCVEYTGDGDSSNMAVLEVSLPSGYVADVESFEEIQKIKGVRLTETKNKESVVVVYFDSLHKQDTKCLEIIAFRQFPVALQKPSPVVLYDYYDGSRKAKHYYESSSKLCEICEDDEECKKMCQ